MKIVVVIVCLISVFAICGSTKSAEAQELPNEKIKRVDFIDQGTIDAVGAKEVTVKKFSFNKDHNTYVLILEDGTKVELSESVKFIIY